MQGTLKLLFLKCRPTDPREEEVKIEKKRLKFCWSFLSWNRSCLLTSGIHCVPIQCSSWICWSKHCFSVCSCAPPGPWGTALQWALQSTHSGSASSIFVPWLSICEIMCKKSCKFSDSDFFNHLTHSYPFLLVLCGLCSVLLLHLLFSVTSHFAC